MLVDMFFVEIIVVNNAMFYTFPVVLAAIPIGISIYLFITLFPKWLVEQKIKENKWKVVMSFIWILGVINNLIT